MERISWQRRSVCPRYTTAVDDLGVTSSWKPDNWGRLPHAPAAAGAVDFAKMVTLVVIAVLAVPLAVECAAAIADWLAAARFA